ncbi:RNA polymerase sigma factor [Kribbella sp. NPDC002412]
MSQPPDHCGFEDWYRREFPDLLLFARRIGASWQESFDLAQEACAKAFPHWAAIENPRAYVRVAIRNAYVKDARRRREVPVSQVDDQPVRSDLAVRRIEFHDQERQVMAAIRRLPLGQRVTIAWSIDGFTPAEIAEILDRPPASVRVSLHHARAALRISLAGLRGDHHG